MPVIEYKNKNGETYVFFEKRNKNKRGEEYVAMRFPVPKSSLDKQGNYVSKKGTVFSNPLTVMPMGDNGKPMVIIERERSGMPVMTPDRTPEEQAQWNEAHLENILKKKMIRRARRRKAKRVIRRIRKKSRILIASYNQRIRRYEKAKEKVIRNRDRKITKIKNRFGRRTSKATANPTATAEVATATN